MENNFSNNPIFLTMDPQKADFIKNFASKNKPTTMQEAMPFLLSHMNLAKKQNIQFSKPEIQLIAEVLSQNLSPQEKAKINQIMSTMLK